MVKTKQVATKRPRERAELASFTPQKKAIKSASNQRADALTNPAFKSPSNPAMKSVKKGLKQGSVVNPVLQTIPKARKRVARAHEEARQNRIPLSQQLEMSRKSRFAVYSIPRKSFQVLTKRFSHMYMRDCRFTRDALEALQTAVEDYMVGFFEDAALCMRHANRKTLQFKDLELVTRLRKSDYIPL